MILSLMKFRLRTTFVTDRVLSLIMTPHLNEEYGNALCLNHEGKSPTSQTESESGIKGVGVSEDPYRA